MGLRVCEYIMKMSVIRKRGNQSFWAGGFFNLTAAGHKSSGAQPAEFVVALSARHVITPTIFLKQKTYCLSSIHIFSVKDFPNRAIERLITLIGSILEASSKRLNARP